MTDIRCQEKIEEKGKRTDIGCQEKIEEKGKRTDDRYQEKIEDKRFNSVQFAASSKRLKCIYVSK